MGVLWDFRTRHLHSLQCFGTTFGLSVSKRLKTGKMVLHMK